VPAAIPEDLSAIQAKLFPYLGPITPRLVAKAAARTTSRRVLVKDLAEHIPDPRDREAFLKACQPQLVEPEAARSPATPVPTLTLERVNWEPDYLEKVKQSLARHIGPIAGVLVDRACKRVSTRQQLYAALAAHIPSEKDRSAFLQSVPQ
jgi:serine/threonine-protein kinase